ncbi:SatD family protein [Clostridium thermarum]|uniref:SatD family protein n=1 Tax=Clostridium thermarum TaxID=1716543 RepID=UPI00111E2371|nr:SatD family protein [Clostridium thermarum]
MKEKQFAVITADIVGSKKGIPCNPNENPKSLLDKKISNLNKRLLELGIKTITPFRSSRGDEIQCVCGELKNIPVLIRYLRFYCQPFKLRVGLGLGEIDYFYLNNIDDEVAMDYNDVTHILEEHYTRLNSWDMNGNAFYFARKAIDNLKQNRESNSTCISMKDSNLSVAIQTIFELMDVIMAEWWESKWNSVQMYDEYGTYEKAARILNLTKQAVQGNCERAKWHIIKGAESNLSKIFEFIDNS